MADNAPHADLNGINDSTELRESIERYYLPRHLVKAILEIGHIPADSRECFVGVGFIDIADYTRISKFLSPKENQILLNGLYTAFQTVLERFGGYLNKIEGDSMMFQFDSVVNRKIRDLESDEMRSTIARELFYTCVEMQRVCNRFNQASEDFIDPDTLPESRQSLIDAFEIIKTLRCKEDIASSALAFFQIRIRIGANIGDVTIGNIGPRGSKHWDIIGTPVIVAKRMESTAAVGGLRISQDYYRILKENGIIDDYYRDFRAEARAKNGAFAKIALDELFRFHEVTVEEKRGAKYPSYSVQVDPVLPEALARQADELLNHGVQGVEQIIEIFRYYRGNHFVIDALEKALSSRGVEFRKLDMIRYLSPKKAAEVKNTARVSLFRIFHFMDQYLDYVQALPHERQKPEFLSYEQFMATVDEECLSLYKRQKGMILQKNWFTGVIVPKVFASLESSLREYQLRASEVEDAEIADLEEFDEANEP